MGGCVCVWPKVLCMHDNAKRITKGWQVLNDDK